ncbi:ornithine cyclodeaminase family protein [uncultured Tateyamaria sp.]|uniref:ornithine cyclodeaminase family protein n=1 Tax=uncultured Tateyamaria sp. TaxID=455651 RepID=UPI00262886C5|nr:ornithine cyclodeaminase family protein [uncultured Tateyamaria sp.]
MISLSRAEIEALIDLPVAARAIEAAYRATSRGDVTLPPVGHITFPEHDADCHIKYGHMADDPTFVIKVATGFPGNGSIGLPTGNGLVLVLSAETGAVEAMLHDEMMLTDIRTGLGGAIASRTLARPDSRRALVIGTGPQARRQIEAHAALMSRLSFQVWGRDARKVAELVAEMAPVCDVTGVDDLEAAVRQPDVIITATGSTAPLLRSDWVLPGTHITAVGADAPGKQELDVALVARADVLAVDLVAQCVDHGEVSHAAAAGLIQPGELHEIGALLEHPERGRKDAAQVTIADLTGIAAQDIAMANAILAAWREQSG